jgi:hypothetical protein
VLARGGLEELDRIAGWVVEQDLLTTGAPDDVIAELQSGGAQPLDLGDDVTTTQVTASPKARFHPNGVRRTGQGTPTVVARLLVPHGAGYAIKGDGHERDSRHVGFDHDPRQG